MALPFDYIASPYNSAFSQSAIGQLQRKQVWKYIETIIQQLRGYEMLELNQGSGEDALLFSDKGFSLLATDVNEELLKVTQKKSDQFSMQHKISSRYLDLEAFNETLFDKKFDLVFSNFGGLNAINPESLQKLITRLPSILNPGGRFIGVVMSKFCAWETIYFLLHFRFRKAFRRMTSKEVLDEAQGMATKTWYYHPSQLKSWSKKKFRLIKTVPVGLALPSFYLEALTTFQKTWLMRLNKIESTLSRSSMFSGMADNYLIDLQLL